MLTKDQKIKQVAWIKQQLETKPLVVFTTYRGLNITDMTFLRRQLKGQAIVFKVVKSSLLKLAMKELGLVLDESVASAPVAIAAGQDEVIPAKLIARFIIDHESLQIVGGVKDKKLVDADTVKKLALLPSREELYAKFIGVLRAPTTRLVAALGYPRIALTLLLKQKLSMKGA